MWMKRMKNAIADSVADRKQCCFCEKEIECKALVVMNLDLGDGQYQTLFSHGLCLKEKLHPTVPFLAPEEVY